MCQQCTGPSAARTRRQVLGTAAGAAAFVLLPRPAQSVLPDTNVAPDLMIRPRDAWSGDLTPRAPMPPEDVRFLLVHHTAGSNSLDPADVVPTLRSVFAFHTGPDKGWADVAYNFFIDPFGVVWEGRAGSIAGPVTADATGGNQGFAQLVCLLGDFTSQLPTPEAIDALTRTLAWLADRYRLEVGPSAHTSFTSRGSNRWAAGDVVDTNTIAGHRDMSATACPGDRFYPTLSASVIPAVLARVTASTTTTPTTTATTTTPRPAGSAGTNTIAPVTAAAPSFPVTPTVTSTLPNPTVSIPGSTDAGDDRSGLAGVAGVAGAVVTASALVARRRRSRSERDRTADATPTPPQHEERG